MSVASVGSTNQTTDTSGQLTTKATGSSTLGKNEFLKLLTTQLANQDPLNPTDNEQFIAQLATFASVEQQEAAVSRLDSLILAQASNNQTTTASLVGKDVTFKTDSVSISTDGGAQISGELSANAASVKAIIKDSTGKVVRTLDFDDTDAGTVTQQWDGKDSNGVHLPAGDYKIELVASDSSGGKIGVTQRGSGQVSGISFEDGVPKLMVNGTKIAMADVIEILQPTTSTSSNTNN